MENYGKIGKDGKVCIRKENMEKLHIDMMNHDTSEKQCKQYVRETKTRRS